MKDFTFLEFDTGLFGYRVARIDKRDLTSALLKDILVALKKEEARLAYLFLEPDSGTNDVAINCGGLKVDSKAVFENEIRREGAKEESQFIVSYPQNTSCKPLYPLAYQSGIYSRFRLDPNFTRGEFEKLYTMWIEKSVKREIADEVLTYTDNGTPVGLVTYSLQKDRGRIGLFSVDEGFRGKSVGRNLMLHAVAALDRSGAKRVSVATQLENETACLFYKKQGFVLQSVQNVFHFWL
jgi:dTDP-4-amino-4,6-dideoxy-D-galactose acyltransferase